ncbi:adenosylcobinamide-phosphate synthase CbiB [Ancylomarina sp. 16SWW S1-10-2]|uniref:adenosylcobinamide-phosphate synthase CbiB n=1 Tax=Ancylomarina sp. 16SWW S1-10-2 TaxID=2499681 RepID=UPI0012AD50BB|nr:adenosylcobinamide-phosphate synthase CbiB [Ancylomarina sp. 16SWW S1-10-2]MRT92735.1 cobalamin biosynthesis protein CobD [Ancylomarina sp. 16SWW S1-10-2]
MEQIELIILPLIIGYILDLILGDPRNIPHPIIGFGNMITLGTKKLNHGKHRLLKGAFMSLSLILLIYFSFYFLSILIYGWEKWAFIIFTSIFVFYGLANKSLLQEGYEVFKELEEKGLEAGRKRLSWIVGRDTKDLSEQEIRLAVFETLSENLSDGVVAPLFYYAVGGLPAMMAYKMVNTLDSMIGYKNEKYLYFGRVAAYIDDVANLIPARITAFLMVLVSLRYRGFVFIFRYGRSHISPNAGYPESALAGILNCRFGGTHDYGGDVVVKPYIGELDRKIENSEIKRIAYINHAVCFTTIILIIAFYLAINMLL